MQKTEAIEMYLRHGYALFHLTGKAYPIKGWQNAKRNPFINPKKFTQNYGVNLQTDDLIIDVDVSKKKDGTLKKGRESLQKLIDDTGLDISKTFIVQTGTGGFHIYFKKPEDIQVKETWKRTYPDLEFKSRGRYVVGAECVHPDTLKNYIIKRGSLSDVHTAPTELLEKITYKPISFEGIQGLKKYTDDPQAISRAKKLLEMSNISVEGEGGDGQAYVIACRVRGFGVSPQMALDLMLTYWNDRCEPPWDVDELKTKVFNAYSYDTAPQGVNNPEIDFKDVEIDPNIPGEKDFIWATSLRKDNTRVKHIQNTNCYINLEFGTLLKYNLFTDEIEFAEVPSWYPADKTLVPWADNDAVFIKHHLATMQKYDVNVQGIHEAAIINSHFRAYHPLKDYLNALEWDGKKRIDTWLHDYAGVVNDEYSRTVGLKTLLGAITRIYKPGSKFDTVLILEGEQGAGKSRLVEALGKQWYGDMHLDPHHKDTVAVMRNKWIIEISEMTCIKKSEVNAMRSFLSRSTDRHRLSHRRNAEDYPRQSIFIGTINPDAAGYLTDTTGNRRFWPVSVPKRFKIHVDRMERDVDQIWAETLHRYKSGVKELHISDDLVNQMAHAEVEKRRPRDEWFEIIRDWLDIVQADKTKKSHVTSLEIWTDCLNGPARDIKKVDQIRITEIMRELGWVKGSFTKDGKAKFGYGRPKENSKE